MKEKPESDKMVTKVIPFGRDNTRSFTGGQSQAIPRSVLLEGNSEVDELFMEYVNNRKTASQWEFKAKVIRLAQKLMGGDYNWFLKQDSNPLITDSRMSFLLDTVYLLTRGRRRINIHSWKDLLEMDTGNTVDVIKRKVVRELFNELNVVDIDNDTFLQHWLKSPKGFDDLMFSLKYLFGTKTRNL